MRFVVDATIIGGWLMPDDNHAGTLALLEGLADEPALAPDLLAHEVRNLLVSAVRRKRLDARIAGKIADRFMKLPIIMSQAADQERILALALALNLSAYDAAYLAMALDTATPLATLDQRLALAARQSGCRVLPD